MSFSCDNSEEFRMAANGDFHADGDVIANSTTISSDIRLKDNILVIDDPLTKIKEIRGVSFDYIHSGESSYGVIAQELETVLPNAVKEKQLPFQTEEGDDTEYKVVKYDALHALLIESIKELTTRVEELETRLESK